MTVHSAAEVAEMETRWKAWQARGREGDERRKVVVTRMVAIAVALVGGWWIVRLF